MPLPSPVPPPVITTICTFVRHGTSMVGLSSQYTYLVLDAEEVGKLERHGFAGLSLVLIKE